MVVTLSLCALLYALGLIQALAAQVLHWKAGYCPERTKLGMWVRIVLWPLVSVYSLTPYSKKAWGDWFK